MVITWGFPVLTWDHLTCLWTKESNVFNSCEYQLFINITIFLDFRFGGAKMASFCRDRAPDSGRCLRRARSPAADDTLFASGANLNLTDFLYSIHYFTNTPLIFYRVAICSRGNLPYIQITSIVLDYSQPTNYLLGTYLSWRKSTLYPDHLYSATLYPVTL